MHVLEQRQSFRKLNPVIFNLFDKFRIRKVSLKETKTLLAQS